MKLSPLLAFSLAGCSLYFGSGDPPIVDDPPKPGSPGDPTDPGGPLEPRCGKPEVHVFGVYETHGNHGPGNHPPGEARVRIARPGDHALVLSSYEPVNWNVRLGEGVKLESITLIGYHAQTVSLPGVPVKRAMGCGYSYPYNGGGCDTDNLLALAKQHAGADVTTFHGCYQASEWTLLADGTATSNCNTAAGYEVDELIGECQGEPGSNGWEPTTFSTYSPPSCNGARFVRHDEHYGVFVGAILCGDSKHYKLYMSEKLDQPFLEIADYAGHGQDHCELVDPAFTIPDEDDITSGGCTTCSVGPVVDVNGPPVYARANFGQPFERVTSRYWADLTNPVYSCGVSIP